MQAKPLYSIVHLNADGTGSMRNSNNKGGINPASGFKVDVNFGEEHISEFTFNPSALTLFTKDDLILMDGLEVVNGFSSEAYGASR